MQSPVPVESRRRETAAWPHRREGAKRCPRGFSCTQCGVQRDPRAFEGNSKQCTQCRNEAETWRCDACKQELATDVFNHKVLEHAKWHKRKAVCLACAARCFPPRDVDPYPCVECGDKGRLKFARQMLVGRKKRTRGTHSTLLPHTRHRCELRDFGAQPRQ